MSAVSPVQRAMSAGLPESKAGPSGPAVGEAQINRLLEDHLPKVLGAIVMDYARDMKAEDLIGDFRAAADAHKEKQPWLYMALEAYAKLLEEWNPAPSPGSIANLFICQNFFDGQPSFQNSAKEFLAKNMEAGIARNLAIAPAGSLEGRRRLDEACFQLYDTVTNGRGNGQAPALMDFVLAYAVGEQVFSREEPIRWLPFWEAAAKRLLRVPDLVDIELCTSKITHHPAIHRQIKIDFLCSAGRYADPTLPADALKFIFGLRGILCPGGAELQGQAWESASNLARCFCGNVEIWMLLDPFFDGPGALTSQQLEIARDVVSLATKANLQGADMAAQMLLPKTRDVKAAPDYNPSDELLVVFALCCLSAISSIYSP